MFERAKKRRTRGQRRVHALRVPFRNRQKISVTTKNARREGTTARFLPLIHREPRPKKENEQSREEHFGNARRTLARDDRTTRAKGASRSRKCETRGSHLKSLTVEATIFTSMSIEISLLKWRHVCAIVFFYDSMRERRREAEETRQ